MVGRLEGPLVVAGARTGFRPARFERIQQNGGADRRAPDDDAKLHCKCLRTFDSGRQTELPVVAGHTEEKLSSGRYLAPNSSGSILRLSLPFAVRGRSLRNTILRGRL